MRGKESDRERLPFRRRDCVHYSRIEGKGGVSTMEKVVHSE